MILESLFHNLPQKESPGFSMQHILQYGHHGLCLLKNIKHFYQNFHNLCLLSLLATKKRHSFVNQIIFLIERAARMCSVKKVFLKISQNSQENTLVRILFSFRPATLLNKRLWHRCFTRNFAKFLRTPSPTEHLRWLLLFLPIPKNYCMRMNSNFTGNQS